MDRLKQPLPAIAGTNSQISGSLWRWGAPLTVLVMLLATEATMFFMVQPLIERYIDMYALLGSELPSLTRFMNFLLLEPAARLTILGMTAVILVKMWRRGQHHVRDWNRLWNWGLTTVFIMIFIFSLFVISRFMPLFIFPKLIR